MSKIDLVLVSMNENAKAAGKTKAARRTPGSAFAVRQYGGGSDAEKLASAWPAVMEKLSVIVNNSELPQSQNDPGLKLDSIEVHLGIEAGFTIGFSAKTNADVTLTFKRAGS